MRDSVHEEDGKVHVKYEEDVQSAIDYAHDKRVQEGEFERMGEWKHVMRIPEIVMLDIRNTYGWDYMNPEHWPMVKKLVFGPEYAKFRTTNKRIAT